MLFEESIERNISKIYSKDLFSYEKCINISAIDDKDDDDDDEIAPRCIIHAWLLVIVLDSLKRFIIKIYIR